MGKRPKLLVFLTAVLSGTVVLAWWPCRTVVSPPAPEKPVAVAPPVAAATINQEAIYSAASFYDRAFEEVSPLLPSDEAARTVAVVTPHHLVVRRRIAALFAALAGERYDTVVIVSPDHFAHGRARATVSAAAWQTPFGTLPPDLASIGSLAASGATVEETPFIKEHGITGLVGFVGHAKPQAKMVTLLLREDAKAEQVDRLAAALAAMAERQRILVVASVDFTHEADAAAADLQDAATVADLESFDLTGLATSNVDSPMTLRLLSDFARQRGATRFRELSHTHSGRLTGHPESLGTSHVIGAYLK